MAGNDYFDADAYLAEQAARNEQFSQILGANQGGTSPIPGDPTMTSPAAAPAPEDRSSAFRRIMSSGLPGQLPYIGPAVDQVSHLTGYDRREVEPTGPLGPSTAFKTTPKTEYFDADAPYPEVKAAPTLASQARQAVGGSLAMGGGGSPTTSGLAADLRHAQQDQLDTMGHGADLALDLGQNRASAQSQMADLRAAQAEQMRQDALRQQQIEADANARHEAFLAKSQQMADAIAADNIDPARFLHSADAKTQFIWGLASAIGGANASANGGRNEALDRLDGIMDRDFKGQLAKADNARSALGARNTVFGQIMAQTQDSRLAELQGRDLMYTAMKTKLLSDADRLGVPEIMTQAKQAANEIENKQAMLRKDIAAQSLQASIAAANAAAAHRAAAEERAYRMGQDAIHNNQKQQEIDIAAGKSGPGGKETGERAVVLDGQDALAVNKTAAEKWNEYNHGRAVFATALQELKAARERGDVGGYNAARANLIEEYPKLLGYTRAPTEGQIKATVGPEAIPEYNHWYDHAKYGPVGAVTYKTQQGRAEEKLAILDKTLAVSDKAMRENTFGAKAPTAPTGAPNFKPDPIKPPAVLSPENPWTKKDGAK